jgi:hypothetical protein
LDFGDAAKKNASVDFNLLPCDISPDFLYRGAYRGINVPGA